ncbi:MAG TPA: S9 family peptidase [Acidobacteriaceae bacterium]|nr:S9 family peptidase [Acidobacteriaceae bacterium]
MNKRTFVLTLVGIAVLFGAAPPSHASQQLQQTLDAIFTRHEYEQKSFGPARWIDGGAAYTTVEPSPAYPNSAIEDIVRYDTESGKRAILVSASQLAPSPGARPLVIDDYVWSQDAKFLLIYTNSRRVWRQNTRGDYWVVDLAKGGLKKLGGDAPESSLMFAQFSPDGRMAAYVRANNIYAEDLQSGNIRKLTSDGSDTIINGTSDWISEEEFDIRNGFRWSPDCQSIAYWQFNTSGVGIYTLIDDTSADYPTVKRYAYPQPGTTNSAVRVGVVNIATGATVWMNPPGDTREHYIARMDWAGNSDEVILEYLNRLQNDNQVLLADSKTGAVRKILEDTDPAWVDIVDSFEWTDHGKSLLWLSERDGWRHIYSASRDGSSPQLLTREKADVIKEVFADDKGGWLYYLASPDNATEKYLYRSRSDGSGSTVRVTPTGEPGTHSYDISPDGRWAFHTWSTADRPPITDLIRLPDHKAVRVLEDNAALAQKARTLVTSPTEFFQVAISAGVKLDGWMIKPPNFDPTKKYPVLVYVYGEPANATVTNSWGGARMFFHRALAQDGYIVVSFDNQGTPAPKGRAWRKVVYGDVGVLSSQQQTEAIQELAKERPYVDPTRLAIWGWSGGGSNTLNLMFRSPAVFAAGMAVAPVADQRYYDSIYQERYMGLPRDNAQGYHDGSPINFAQGLQGHLLIVHGSGDDNVHYKGTELLLNRLVALNKPFDFMDYPNRTHAIREGPGTTVHLYNLLARYLEEHVPSGAQPR